MSEDELVLLLAEERISVAKKMIEGDLVRVITRVESREETVSEALTRGEVSIERVAIGRPVAEAPLIRKEDDVLVIPVCEEVLVVEKRLLLKEELRITRTSRTEAMEQTVVLRRMSAAVERLAPQASASPLAGDQT